MPGLRFGRSLNGLGLIPPTQSSCMSFLHRFPKGEGRGFLPSPGGCFVVAAGRYPCFFPICLAHRCMRKSPPQNTLPAHQEAAIQSLRLSSYENSPWSLFRISMHQAFASSAVLNHLRCLTPSILTLPRQRFRLSGPHVSSITPLRPDELCALKTLFLMFSPCEHFLKFDLVLLSPSPSMWSHTTFFSVSPNKSLCISTCFVFP